MADIQLSPRLFQEIQEAILRQHADADSGVVMQYLAAITGYMLGSERALQEGDKEEFLRELCAFAERVYRDVQAQQEQQQQQRAATAQQAFGYWEPPKDSSGDS